MWINDNKKISIGWHPCHQAITLLGAVCRVLPWAQYEVYIKYYIGLFTKVRFSVLYIMAVFPFVSLSRKIKKKTLSWNI